MAEVHITGDPEADELLGSDPFALLIGMLLDQQVPMETAFAGPAKLKARLGAFDPATIAGHDPVAFAEVMKQSPAVHRFPGSMAERVQAVAAAVRDEWGGDAAAIWTRDDPDGAEVLARLMALPGFGAQKAKIFLAVLGKQYGVDPAGWREASQPYGSPGTFLSVADIVDATSLTKVREAKKAAKAAAKAATAAKGS